MVYSHSGMLFGSKNNGALIYATVWMDLRSIMQSERHQTQKASYYMTQFIGNAIYWKQVSDCQGLERGREQGATAKGRGSLFGAMKIF